MLASGKLPSELLARLLQALPITDPQLLLGPAVGEDAAVIDFAPGQDLLLVAKSDPITFATEEIGYYAVNVCANDLAVTGAKPRFYLPTILLPAGQTDARRVEQIFAQIADSCRRLGIVVAGGHSEITPTVSQVVVAGTMLGEVMRSQVVRSGGCRPGDVVLMAGVAPVEGTSIIARAKRQTLLTRGWSIADLDQAANFLHEPGISILQPAQLAAERQLVSAMHDPTEGGVATALLELSMAAGVGLAINLAAIVIPALARRLCAEFDLDPLGVIASGALLATTAPEQAETLVALWKTHGWPVSIIGQVLAPEAGLQAHQGERQVPFPHFAVDEITKLWA